MKRLTFNAAMEQFREQFPRIETDPDISQYESDYELERSARDWQDIRDADAARELACLAPRTSFQQIDDLPDRPMPWDDEAEVAE